jgi:hypothetical protein
LNDFEKENKANKENHKENIAVKMAQNEENLKKLEEILTIDIN